jgi:murein endopeptidase
MSFRLLIGLSLFSFFAFAENNFQLNPFADPRVSPVLSSEGTRVYGKYQEGCLEGAIDLSNDRSDWEVLKPSRHRHFGTPEMRLFLEYLSEKSGRLEVGDVAHPAGGPLIGGHASHETGLDADLRYEVLSKLRILTRQERESRPAVKLAIHELKGYPRKSHLESHMFKAAWNDNLGALLKNAAEYYAVERIFVSPPIKKLLCDKVKDKNYPKWLAKVRPWWGHDDHFHVRISCPILNPDCVAQEPVGRDATDPTGVGCAGKDFAWWFDTDLKKKKTNPLDNGPTFLAHEIYEKRYPPIRNKPKWLEQVEGLPKQCQDLKAKLVMQLKFLPGHRSPAVVEALAK